MHDRGGPDAQVKAQFVLRDRRDFLREPSIPWSNPCAASRTILPGAGTLRRDTVGGTDGAQDAVRRCVTLEPQADTMHWLSHAGPA